MTTKAKQELLKKINEDPVLWAKAFLITYNNAKKCYEPWNARWYQAEMLRDQSRKKVYRCGRRTGRDLPVDCELLECLRENQQPSSIL